MDKIERGGASMTVFEKTLNVKGKQKTVRVVNCALADIDEKYDILVFSAYKDDYLDVPKTVIGELYRSGIDVQALADAPQLNCKDFGVWLSSEIDDRRFKRLCCVELLDYRGGEMFEKNFAVDIVLKKTFSTLKYAIEQATIAGIAAKRILLPILGAGSQGIELGYIIPPLVNQTTSILETLDTDEITFFEIDGNKAARLRDHLRDAFDNGIKTDVFISYSSKQTALAYDIAAVLKKNGITYWMAPDSIPPSDDYLDAIPNALTNTRAVLLILTPDAEASKWVPKEVATAIGADKTVIPCKMLAYELSDKFKFLLDGCQIYACYLNNDYPAEIVRLINGKK